MIKMIIMAVLSMLTGAIVTHWWHQRHENKELQKLRAENARLSQENGWLMVALAARGVEIMQFLAEARKKAEFIPLWQDDRRFSVVWRLALIATAIGGVLTPAMRLY